MTEKIRVVIADQHPLFIMGFEGLMNACCGEYELSGKTSDIKEAVSLCKTRNADLLILGELTSWLEGPVLVSWVRSHSNVKWICCMDSRNLLNINDLLEAGADAFISKQESPYALRQGLDQLCNNAGKISHKNAADRGGNNEHYHGLTSREHQVLQLIIKGYKNKDMANSLYISEKTVESHRLNIMKKMQVHNAIELFRCALQRGMCQIE